MEPCGFDESNTVLGKPEGMTHEECDALQVFRGLVKDDYAVVISCWKLTAQELEEINRTGRVWLMVLGVTMPPVCLSGVKFKMGAEEQQGS